MNIHPNKGMALLHKHGDDCLKHEAEMVANGANGYYVVMLYFLSNYIEEISS